MNVNIGKVTGTVQNITNYTGEKDGQATKGNTGLHATTQNHSPDSSLTDDGLGSMDEVPNCGQSNLDQVPSPPAQNQEFDFSAPVPVSSPPGNGGNSPENLNHEVGMTDVINPEASADYLSVHRQCDGAGIQSNPDLTDNTDLKQAAMEDSHVEFTAPHQMSEQVHWEDMSLTVDGPETSGNNSKSSAHESSSGSVNNSLSTLSEQDRRAPTDGDGNSAIPDSTTETGSESDILVLMMKNLVVQDESDPSVSVVEVLPNSQMLECLEQTGDLADGSSQLWVTKWKGHRDFDLSLWKLTWKSINPPSGQLQNIIRSFRELFQDAELQCLTKILKHLNTKYEIFFHSVSWQNGLSVFLGHINPEVRSRHLQSPLKEDIQSILLQLLPDCVLDLMAWEEPTSCNEQDIEGQQQSNLSEVVNHPCSFTTEALFESGEHSLSQSGAMQSSQLSTGNSENARNIRNSPFSSSSAVSLIESFGNFVREECSSFTRKQPFQQELVKQIHLQWQKGLADLSKHHRMEVDDLKQTVNIAKDATDHSLSLIHTLLQDQKLVLDQMSKRMTEMIETQDTNKKNQEDINNNWSKQLEQVKQTLCQVIEEKEKQHIDHMEEMKDMMHTQYQQINAEVNKQCKNVEMLQQDAKQQVHQQETVLRLLKLQQDRQRLSGLPQPGSGHDVLAMTAQEETLTGAVGGTEMTRNTFTSALAQSEQTTKIQGKEEEMSHNQLEDKIRLPPLGQAAFDQLEKLTALAANAQVTQERSVPPKDSFSSAASSLSTSLSAQYGARRSKGPKGKVQKPGQVNAEKGRESPGAERKVDSTTQSDRRKGTKLPESEGKPDSLRESSQQETGASSPDVDSADLLRAEQFLDWISIHSGLNGSKDISKMVAKHVSVALKKEVKPAPRAKCLDTILCLDISDSIVKNKQLDVVKNTALEFVNGIEDLMDEMELEENIAVIAMGGHARVVQHLTNDLTLVREAIESLDSSGGRSPFMQALMVCLAANKGRGGVVNVSGVYKVRPRIIFITDGFPSDESQETGCDTQNISNEVLFPLVQLLTQLASKKQRSTPRPISWVPVGHKRNEPLLKNLAGLPGNELVNPREIRHLCRYYKVQQTIGRLLKLMKAQGEDIQDGKMKEILDAMTCDTITSDEKEYVIEEVKRILTTPEEPKEPEADDFDFVFEDVEKVKNGELLALGTRVVRGPDWKWKNQDTDGPGTVIQHNNKGNWIFIKWDNGMHNAYRYGEEGKTDVVESQHHPRQIAPDSTTLNFGVRVARGPDWKSGNEDGKGLGTVIRCRNSDEKVKVRWDKTAEIHEYTYSLKMGREVQIHLPEFPRGPHSESEDIVQDTDANNGRTIPIWKWRDGLRQWRLYDEETNDKLETEHKKRPNASCIIFRAGQNRRVIFSKMQEKSVDDGNQIEVCREMVDEERKNDLLAIEISLQNG